MSDAAIPDDEPVRLLTVCTGNICRSPYAAVLLQEGLSWARPGVFQVTSAGTHALIGRPMDPMARGLLEDKEVRSAGAQARLLSARVVEKQAVVLVMDDHHREMVLDESPSAHRRTIGLVDLATALRAVDEQYDWPDLLADAGAKEVRGRWRVLPSVLMALGQLPVRVEPVADPYGRGLKAFGRMAEQVDPAVRSIVRWEAQFAR
ncbi:hypothetical protein JQN72_13475 [Phycicoccus sp. CSK15P-2]|uniref:arsenate reductase/protein-tyrosine-phosphatase family protein n=1 Tax=Phycicoccus sp. CSK15P-2 TaxID=2807627 RepID=UPI001951AEB7|nr:hypothetical protein [Phycicoccus sp. CSK15P-2]MBM6405251.1 hypothetical protein [Phycicoccus sp. CSK15P-2]